MSYVEVLENELSLVPSLNDNVTTTLRKLKARAQDPKPLLVDSTMLYAPRSGGVKRYLLAKKAWLAANRPLVDHALVVPGAKHSVGPDNIIQIRSPKLPFGDGYRWPSSPRKWGAWITAMNPKLIEAGDPYTAGQGALEAGQRLGVPVIGFCHSDPAALAALHFGEWAKKPVEKRWAKLFGQFDTIISPSRFIASRLEEAGLSDIVIQPLGVEIDTFHPDRRDRPWLLKKLGLTDEARILCFAGRPAREKNIGVLIEAVQKLGEPYHLVLVGAGAGLPHEDRVICLEYERDPKAVARIVASCDAFVHANDKEPFGLIVLEAMACGRPVVGVNAGGVAENVDESVGQLSATADSSDYAEAIEVLFQRDIDQLGQNARERAVQKYAWNRVFEGLSFTYAQTSGCPQFAMANEQIEVN